MLHAQACSALQNPAYRLADTFKTTHGPEKRVPVFGQDHTQQRGVRRKHAGPLTSFKLSLAIISACLLTGGVTRPVAMKRLGSAPRNWRQT